MKRNVGGIDRTIRFILGILFLIAALTAPVAMEWRIGMFILAAIGLATASMRFCPINAALQFNTCKGDQHDTANQ